MPSVKSLTSRDIELLQCLARYNVISVDRAKIIFGNTEQYHYRRAKDLCDRGYLKLGKGYIEATKLGNNAVGYEEPPLRIRTKLQLIHKSLVAEVAIGLTNWQYISPREAKENINIARSSRLDGIIKNDKEEYVFYLLDRDPRTSTLQSLRNEINNYPYEYNMNKLIVFCLNTESMDRFVKHCTNLELKELLLLPFPYGVEMINNKQLIDSYIADSFKNYDRPARTFADYQKGNEYVSVLAFNDIIKRNMLLSYMNIKELEGKEAVIVCLKNQSQKLSEQFPRIKLKIIPEFWRGKDAVNY